MSKATIGMTVAVLASACGPQVDGEEPPPGELVYEDSSERLYRGARRFEVIYDYERQDGLEGKCGALTDRAFDDLERTLAALDLGVDYGEHPADCTPNRALVYIDGFEHSPFECGISCCHPDLYGAVVVYTMVLNNFDGIHPTIDGEPYVAIEPDQPCP